MKQGERRAERETGMDRLRKPRPLRAVTAGAGSVLVAMLMLALPAAASGGQYLQPSTVHTTGYSTWVAGCNTDQQTNWRYNSQSGTFVLNQHNGPSNTNGVVALSLASAAGVNNYQYATGHVTTSDYFDVGPSSSGCFSESSSTSVSVTYYWDINGAADVAYACPTGGSVSASVSVDLYGDVHQNGGYAGPSHAHQNIASLTSSQNCGTYPSGIQSVTTNGWQQYSVTYSGTLSSGTSYDFFSSITVDMNNNAGSTSGTAITSFANITAILVGVACANC